MAGQQLSASLCHCAHAAACCQVSVYHQLQVSLGPQDRNPLLCASGSAPVLHSRSAKYHFSSMVPVPMHMVKYLYTTAFHFGLKIVTLCFVWDQPDVSAVAWTWQWNYTVDIRLLFWAYSFLELSTFLVSQNTNSCFNTISHFSSTKKQQPDSKDTKNENEKCFQMMMKTVNSVLRCNMNHHTMIFPCLIVLGLLERTLPYFYNCCANLSLQKVINFTLSLLFAVWIVQALSGIYILIRFQLTSVLCKSLHQAGLLYWICKFFQLCLHFFQ